MNNRLKIEAKFAKERLQELFPDKRFSVKQIYKNLKTEGPDFARLNRCMLISTCDFMRIAKPK